MKAFTDLEQSKKLEKILPLESADMWWAERFEGKVLINGQHVVSESPTYYQSFVKPSEYNYSQDVIKDIPCWSLAALMHILPSKFTEKGKYSETTYEIDIRKHALTDDVDVYQIAYGNCHQYVDGISSWSDMINSSEKEELIDICVEMILKLYELKLCNYESESKR